MDMNDQGNSVPFFKHTPIVVICQNANSKTMGMVVHYQSLRANRSLRFGASTSVGALFIWGKLIVLSYISAKKWRFRTK